MNGIIDMKEIGKYLNGLLSKQNTAAEKAARYFDVHPRYPTLTGYDPSLLNTPIMGYEAEDDLESIIGPNIIVAYNPVLVTNPKLRDTVPVHEGVHVVQPGKDKLERIYASTPFGVYPLGHALLEGGAELVMEKIGETRSGVYETEYRFAKKFDEHVMDLRDVYKTAESKGTAALVDILNRPEIKKEIYRILLEDYAYNTRN